MHITAVTRRLSRVSTHRLFVPHLLSQDASPPTSTQFRYFRAFTPPNITDSNLLGCSNGGIGLSSDLWFSKSHTAPFCSAPATASDDHVKELHDKILEFFKVKGTAPPNALLWSMIEKSKREDDIKLLFDVLQQLRIFRLSSLRIHDNFNCNLCQEVTKACICAGALKFGMKALWRHNVYGLTPTIGSANLLLAYAKKQKDVKLMVDIMSHLKKNYLPLQPATADIVFSICFDADNWERISKYAKRFIKAGVKLRKTTFDTWMEFALVRGDLESLQNIEKLRSELYEKHTIRSGFSRIKGLLLQHKPEDAATILQDVTQAFPESKRQDIICELQKLVSKWPAEVAKHQKPDDQKALIASLKADITVMINSLSSGGINLSVNLSELKVSEPMPS